VIVEPRFFGSGLRGPAHADVTALAWNPAALGLLEGSHAYGEASLDMGSGLLERSPLDRFPDDATDEPLTFESADYHTLSPGYFFGMSHDFGNRVTAGLGSYTPFVETSGQGDWPGAYYRREVDWYHLYAPAFAVSYRVGGGFYFGVGLNMVWSWLHTSFDRDTALEGGSPAIEANGFENEEQAQEVAIETKGGPGFTAAIGVAYRLKRNFNIGVSWQLRPQPVRTEGSVRVSERRGVFEGRASAEYELPDIVNAGVEWQPTERLGTSLTLRYVSAHLHDRLTIRPSGNNLSIRSGDTVVELVPESIVFYRGFQDTWALDGAASYALHPTLDVGLGAMLETSAVKERSVNAAQVDGPKVAGRLFTRWRPVSWFSIGAAWELTVMRDRAVDRSDFDPDAAVRCVDSGYNVDDCDELSQGRALPEARGRYELLGQRVTAGISVDTW